MQSIHWKDKEKEKLFFRYASQIPDEELAKMLGVSSGIVAYKRRKHGIPPWSIVYTKELLEYIEQHFHTMGNVDLASNLNKLYPQPGHIFTKDAIRTKLAKLGWKRTEEEQRKTNQLGLNANEKYKKDRAENTRRYWQENGTKPGHIIKHGKSFRIKLSDGSYVSYPAWLWKYHYGSIPPGKYVAVKDRSKPITIDNLELIQQGWNLVTGMANLENGFVLRRLNISKEIRRIIIEMPNKMEELRAIVQLTNVINEQNKKLALSAGEDGK